MTVANYTKTDVVLVSWVFLDQEQAPATSLTQASSTPKKRRFSPLKPIRNWLDRIEVSDRKLAHTLCKLIPAQCPFERDIKLFGRTLLHIPPMCKLNPFYEEVVSLRFKALCYLADRCGEDVTIYC